jgi:hypothetical protein
MVGAAESWRISGGLVIMDYYLEDYQAHIGTWDANLARPSYKSKALALCQPNLYTHHITALYSTKHYLKNPPVFKILLPSTMLKPENNQC